MILRREHADGSVFAFLRAIELTGSLRPPG
jgi:hypothetical protein